MNAFDPGSAMKFKLDALHMTLLAALGLDLGCAVRPVGSESDTDGSDTGDGDGDTGNADADDPTDMDGQIMVREQMSILGNSEFQGRVMVENSDSASNAYDPVTNPNGRRNASTLSSNNATGNMRVTYNGSLGGLTFTSPGGPDTYTNIISGWMESQ
jgi:hypothetical protein